MGGVAAGTDRAIGDSNRQAIESKEYLLILLQRPSSAETRPVDLRLMQIRLFCPYDQI
jgi:hypothetical protein